MGRKKGMIGLWHFKPYPKESRVFISHSFSKREAIKDFGKWRGLLYPSNMTLTKIGKSTKKIKDVSMW